MIAGDASMFPRGLLRPELFMGIVTAVSASQACVGLSVAGAPTGSHFETGRYGRGEVGELVLIEGQVDIVLGRVVDVRLPEFGRRSLASGPRADEPLEVSGFVQFLGTVRPDTLRVSAGVASYPRLGDRAYAAPHSFVGQIPQLLDREVDDEAAIGIEIGRVNGPSGSLVRVRPEKLFGRHCAILGATGGGKSWTAARLIEESARHNSKIVLLDATGEYRSFGGSDVTHYHLGSPVERASGSTEISLPADDFQESDFIALFEPAGKVQGPKLREAIRSLRLVKIAPEIGSHGALIKAKQPKKPIEDKFKVNSIAVEAPAGPFDALMLAKQLMHECVYPDGGTFSSPDPTHWGGSNDSDKTFCLPLAARIHAILKSVSFAPVFQSQGVAFSSAFDGFLASEVSRVMRVCLGGVSYEYRAREFIVNAIGRSLLNEARKGAFRERPLVVFVDEAHNFLGRSIGYEEGAVRLDAFEIVAREGRKYGLNVCLATQRPRDLTEGVLSQIGTLIVHRLTNDRDRDAVERASGEVDRAASAFLANLRQGEAAVIGVDFPIPLTVHVTPPSIKPKSDGPDYQKSWSRSQ